MSGRLCSHPPIPKPLIEQDENLLAIRIFKDHFASMGAMIRRSQGYRQPDVLP
jgi:hypothetical protein